MSLSRNDDNQPDTLPIAVEEVNGKGKSLIYLHPDEAEEIERDMITDDILRSFYGSGRCKTKKQKDKLREEMYDELTTGSGSSRMLRVVRPLKKGKFFPLPNTETTTGSQSTGQSERQTYFVTGQSGSGKSHFTKKMIEYYKKMKINKIYVITPVQDEQYLKIGAMFLNINDLVENNNENDYEEALIEYKEKKIKYKHRKKLLDPEQRMQMEIELEKMKPDKANYNKVDHYMKSDVYDKIEKNGPCVFVYDDWESFNTADFKKCKWLIENQLTTGRHKGINMLILYHQNTDGMKTRLIINECNNIVIFNRNLFKSYKYLLNTYLGLDMTDINRVKEMLTKSRYCCINRLHRYVVGENKVFLL